MQVIGSVWGQRHYNKNNNVSFSDGIDKQLYQYHNSSNRPRWNTSDNHNVFLDSQNYRQSIYIYYLNLFIILITQQKQINKTHLFIILPSVEVSAASVTRRKYLNIISYKTVIFSCAYTCIQKLQCKFVFRKSMNQTSITI